MNLFRAIILSILQGVSELFPVSSLGHAVLLPKLLLWNLNETRPSWLAFLVALHIGTAAALLIYFRDEWIDVVSAFVRSVQRRQIGADRDERLAWMVILGTVPAGIVGLALKHPLRSLFASPYVAASFLIINGLIMYAGEQLIRRQVRYRPAVVPVDTYTPSTNVDERLARVTGTPVAAREVEPAATGSSRLARRLEGLDAPDPTSETATDTGYRDITQLTWRDAAIVGIAQVGALIPGISRSGVTMVAGLAAGLDHEAAARYAFLLATPIIGAAGVLELPKLLGHSGRPVLGYALLGMVLAGIAAYLSVRFLMRYFQSGRLYPFAYYCVGAGILSLILLSVGA